MAMHNFIRTILALLMLVVFQSTVLAASSVWKVSKGNNVVYVGGTIHVLSKADFPLPKEFDHAYQKSESLVFEADVSKLDSPEGQMLLFAKLLYEPKKKLSQFLQKDTLNQLIAFTNERKVPWKTLNNMKPGMLTVTLTMMELQRVGMSGSGVDIFYENKAKTAGKSIAYLESAREQINLIAGMGIGNENDMVKFLLRDLNQLETLMKKMKSAWRTGNGQAFENNWITPVKTEFPAIYQDLLVKRNNSWLPKIKKMFNSSEVEFVLVGALHLFGEDGVLQLLKDDGFKLVQI